MEKWEREIKWFEKELSHCKEFNFNYFDMNYKVTPTRELLKVAQDNGVVVEIINKKILSCDLDGNDEYEKVFYYRFYLKEE